MAARKIHSTTVIAVRRNGKVAMAGDGQVTAGNTVVKGNARKVRKIYDGKVLTGFAGSVADAFTLFDKFEEKLKEYSGDIMRSAVAFYIEFARLFPEGVNVYRFGKNHTCMLHFILQTRLLNVCAPAHG